MSTFGVVINGVGTFHAAGGLAATLQYVSTWGLITTAVPTAAICILYYNKDARKIKQLSIQAKL